MTNLLVADEINRTSSKTQSALLEAMEEGKVTVDGTTHKLPSPFIVLATENPIGSAGTQLLPVSQLDRFMFKLSMGYPDIKSQVEILRGRHRSDPLDDVKAVCSANELVQTIEVVRQTFICDEVYEYIAELAEQTRHRIGSVRNQPPRCVGGEPCRKSICLSFPPRLCYGGRCCRSFPRCMCTQTCSEHKSANARVYRNGCCR